MGPKDQTHVIRLDELSWKRFAFVVVVETRSHFVAQAVLELII